MKEKKFYTCEFCHTDYKDKRNAIKCESGHKVDLKIVSAKYSSIENDRTGFPRVITVSCDGEEYQYRRY